MAERKIKTEVVPTRVGNGEGRITGPVIPGSRVHQGQTEQKPNTPKQAEKKQGS